MIRPPPRSTLFPYTTLVPIFREAELSARDESERRAREIVTESIQRIAADQTAEVSVSVLPLPTEDRKSTRLNSSHVAISYAVFCLKKKKTKYGESSRTRPSTV